MSKIKKLSRNQKTPRQKLSPEPSIPATKTFFEHIKELRRRLMWIALVLITTSSIAYNFKDQLLQFVLQPLGGEKLIYLTPAGGFSFIFQISLDVGIAIVLPLILYHIYAFMRPALPIAAQRATPKVFIAAFLLMLLGASFGYYYALPAALHFLNNFAGGYITSSLTADSYLSFVVAYTLGLGILFEFPLLLVICNWIKPMTPGNLFKSERYVIVSAFIVAAVISPTPDMFNQAIIAAPIIVIYQMGVVVILLSNHSKKRRLEKTARLSGQPITEELVAIQPSLQAYAAATPEQALAPAIVAALSMRPVRQYGVDGFKLIQRSAKPANTPAVARPSLTRTISNDQVAPHPSKRIYSIDGMSGRFRRPLAL